MEIVRADVSMTEEISRLEKECFSMPWTFDMVKSELENPLAYMLAAIEGERLVGYMGIQMVLDEGYISNVAVSPEFRRRGIASALIEKMKELCKENELSFMTLEVRASNSGAIALYKAAGFAPVGIRRNYYESPQEDAVLMTYFYKQ